MFKTELVIKKVRGRSNKYVVVHPLIFDTGKYGVFTVPAGFNTDLSTYWIEGKHTSAAVVHDFALVTGQGRTRSNDIMYIALKSLGVAWWHRRLILSAITVFGWYAEIKK